MPLEIGLILLSLAIIIGLIIFGVKYKTKNVQDVHVQDVSIQDVDVNRLERLKKELIKVEHSLAEKQKQFQDIVANNDLTIKTNSATALGLANKIESLTKTRNVLTNEIKELERKNQELINKIKEQELKYNEWTLKEIDLREKVNNLVTVHGEMLRRQAQKLQVDGIKLNFSTWELAELKELQDVVNKLRNPVPLEKAIYELYYAAKIKEVVNKSGVSGVCGIYRLSVIVDEVELSYVGQSVNVGNRWVQHLKRAVGADVATAAVLYPSMRKYGIENFKWELLEACEKSLLSEREKYWGAFYAAKETGFNKKLG